MGRPAAWAGGRGGPGFQEGLGQDARQEGAGSFWKGSLDRPGQQPRASPRRAAALPVRAGESAALPGTCRGGGGGQEAAPLQASGWGVDRQEERAAPGAPGPPTPHGRPTLGATPLARGDVVRGPRSGLGSGRRDPQAENPLLCGQGPRDPQGRSTHQRPGSLCLSRTPPRPAPRSRTWEGDRRRPRPAGRHAHLQGTSLSAWSPSLQVL